LTSTDDAGPAVRPVGHALLLALPAIGLMTLILWTFVLMSAMSLALFVDLEIIGVVFFLLMFGVPAGWANLAYGSARHRRRAPHAADRISKTALIGRTFVTCRQATCRRCPPSPPAIRHGLAAPET